MQSRKVIIAIALLVTLSVLLLLVIDSKSIVTGTNALSAGSFSLKAVSGFENLEPESTAQPERLEIRKDVSKDPIKTIAFLGERNSGTTWIHGVLGKCFGEDLKVTNGLTRGRHLFQYDDMKEHNNTLVVVQFRNPYHWVLGMRAKPHHSPEHMYMEWQNFVKKTWNMPRKGLDLLLSDTKNRICQEGFSYNEINSCTFHVYPSKHYDAWKTHYSERRPLYELRNDGSGEPFNNILELRAAKNRDFLTYDSFPFVKKLMVVRYEDLVQEGTASMLREIEKHTGVKAKCEPSPPQTRTAREVDKEFLHYMNKHADWEAETLIGYKQFKGGNEPKHYRHFLM